MHLTTIWQQRQHVEPARIWPFVVGGLFGVPIGVHFLAYTDAAALKIVLAVFLIVFGTYALLAPKLATVTGGGRPADVSIGFLGGILGGTRWLFRRLAHDLDPVARVAKGNSACRVPTLCDRHASSDASGHTVGRIRSHRSQFIDRGIAATFYWNLDRLETLRKAG